MTAHRGPFNGKDVWELTREERDAEILKELRAFDDRRMAELAEKEREKREKKARRRRWRR